MCCSRNYRQLLVQFFSVGFNNEVCETFITCTLGCTSRCAPKSDLAFVAAVEALLIFVALPALEFRYPEFWHVSFSCVVCGRIQYPFKRREEIKSCL